MTRLSSELIMYGSEYPGAYLNGTVVRKVNSEVGDLNPDGARGRVIGSIGHPKVGIGYFVEWDDYQDFAVLVVAAKIEPVSRLIEPYGRSGPSYGCEPGEP